ncbi:unnamed protein product [Phytomonas sp. EM1]|nr:unnamed protein product [Phytomonas sp. EM1]|eukprot:CCW64837.1 unnamed protein product [Phytomonas sp. isolate EM1]
MDPSTMSPLHRHCCSLAAASKQPLSREAIIQHASTYYLWERLYGVCPPSRTLDNLVCWMKGEKAPPPTPLKGARGPSELPPAAKLMGAAEKQRTDDNGIPPIAEASHDATNEATSVENAAPENSEAIAPELLVNEEVVEKATADDAVLTPPPPCGGREFSQEKAKRPRASSEGDDDALKMRCLEPAKGNAFVEKYREVAVENTPRRSEASKSAHREQSSKGHRESPVDVSPATRGPSKEMEGEVVAYDGFRAPRSQDELSNRSLANKHLDTLFTVSPPAKRSSPSRSNPPENPRDAGPSSMPNDANVEPPSVCGDREASRSTNEPACVEDSAPHALSQEALADAWPHHRSPAVESSHGEPPATSSEAPAREARRSRVAATPSNEREHPVEAGETGKPTRSASLIFFTRTPSSSSSSSGSPLRGEGASGEPLPEKKSSGRGVVDLPRREPREVSPWRSFSTSPPPPPPRRGGPSPPPLPPSAEGRPRVVERHRHGSASSRNEFDLPLRVVTLSKGSPHGTFPPSSLSVITEGESRDEEAFPPFSKSTSRNWRSRSQKGLEKGESGGAVPSVGEVEEGFDDGKIEGARHAPHLALETTITLADVRVKDKKRSRVNHPQRGPLISHKKRLRRIHKSIPNEFTLPRAFSAPVTEVEAKKSNPSMNTWKAKKVVNKGASLAAERIKKNEENHSKSGKSHKNK